MKPAQDRLLELADLKPGEKVVELSCGTGLVTTRAAGQVQPGGQIVATDISGTMIDLAQKMARTRQVQNVTFHRMDAEILDLDDNQFDAAICGLGLMYFPDPLEKTYREAGFTDTALERFEVKLPYSTPDEAVLAAFSGGPVALAYDKFDSETKNEVHREYLDSIADYRVDGGYEIPGEFVVAIGYKRA